jgi:hypothetical protein
LDTTTALELPPAIAGATVSVNLSLQCADPIIELDQKPDYPDGSSDHRGGADDPLPFAHHSLAWQRSAPHDLAE